MRSEGDEAGAMGWDAPWEPSAVRTGWAGLDTLKVGRYGEYFAKMALVRAGCDVYSPEVDDRAIDFIIRLPESPPRYVEVQVKTVRVARPGYVFVRKKHFEIEPWRRLALVVLREEAEPELYLIPATAWRDPRPPFTSRDFEGLKSEPEYGLSVSLATLPLIERFRFR